MSQRNEAFAEVEALTRNVEKLDERLAQLDKLAGRNSNSANSNVTLGLGGLAPWLAVTACLVMLAVNIVGSVFIAIALSDLNRQAQELRQADATTQAYINAGLVQPKEPKE